MNSRGLKEQLESHKAVVTTQLAESSSKAIPGSIDSAETSPVPQVDKNVPAPQSSQSPPLQFSVATAEVEDSDAQRTAQADLKATQLLTAVEGQKLLIEDGYSKEQVLNWYQQPHPGLQYRTRQNKQTYTPTPTAQSTTGQSELGRLMDRVEVPSWNGQRDTLQQYKLDVEVLESNIASAGRPLIANRLIEQFTGAPKKHLLVEPDLVGSTVYSVPGAHWQFIERMRKSLGITDQEESHKHFKSYFDDLYRKSGESFLQYMNREEQAYRELQGSLLKVDSSQSQTSDGQSSQKSFLPDRLRGWFFLERSGLS